MQEPFACLNIQAVMRDIDELKEEIKKKQEEMDSTQKQFEKRIREEE